MYLQFSPFYSLLFFSGFFYSPDTLGILSLRLSLISSDFSSITQLTVTGGYLRVFLLPNVNLEIFFPLLSKS